MRYINTEKLKELIEAKYKEYVDMLKQTHASLQYQYIADGLDIAEQLIDFLQQEQTNVDLEKELNDYGYHYDYVSLADRKELMNFAKHFFELGLKAQKGE